MSKKTKKETAVPETGYAVELTFIHAPNAQIEPGEGDIESVFARIARCARDLVHSVQVVGKKVYVYFLYDTPKNLANSDFCYRIRTHFMGKANSTIVTSCELPVAA